MRDLKFRMYALDIDKMFEMDRLHLPCTTKPNPASVYMQYTGLKDKNNRDIYEGDLLRCIDEIDGLTIRIGYVIFERGSYWVSYLPEYLQSDDIMDEDIEYEVIGNAFENKEMYKWNPYN